MRTLIIVAGAVGCLALAGCQQSKSEASTETAAAKPKSLARPGMMYQGQEPILSVSSGAVSVDSAGNLVLKADGTTASAGYTKPTFVRRIYAASPPDGIYEVDVVAEKPAAAGAQAVTPIEAKGEWGRYPEGRLKGVKFMSKTNSVVAMLPPAKGAAGGS